MLQDHGKSPWVPVNGRHYAGDSAAHEHRGWTRFMVPVSLSESNLAVNTAFDCNLGTPFPIEVGDYAPLRCAPFLQIQAYCDLSNNSAQAPHTNAGAAQRGRLSLAELLTVKLLRVLAFLLGEGMNHVRPQKFVIEVLRHGEEHAQALVGGVTKPRQELPVVLEIDAKHLRDAAHAGRGKGCCRARPPRTDHPPSSPLERDKGG